MAQFSVQTDLSGVDPWDGSKSFEDITPGAYKVKTIDAEKYLKQGGGESIHLTFEIAEGKEKGKKGEVYLGLADTEKHGNKRKLLAALMSHGAKLEKIKAAGANLVVGEATFTGKNAFVLVKEPSADALEKAKAQGYNRALTDKEYLTPAAYEALVKAAAVVGTNGTGTGAAPSASTPSGPAPKAADLFND